MASELSDNRIQHLLEEIYISSLDPKLWSKTLGDLARIFNGVFADLFTRSHDRSYYRGVCYGLDKSDYEGQFLDVWFRRNIWGNTKPVMVAGEVISTRDIVDVQQLMRTEIYENYLAPRDLHEGLRLSLWVNEHDIQDISILRPWSAGAFDASEILLGQYLLPHLQRAAAVTRRLSETKIVLEAGFSALEASSLGVFLFDAAGAGTPLNAVADKVLAEGKLLTLVHGQIRAATPALTRDLHHAVARAIGQAGSFRQGSLLRLTSPTAFGYANLMILPIYGREDWIFARPPSAIALMRDPSMLAVPEGRLASLFGLTPAEAELAKHLLLGLRLRDIASRTGRSLHTVRNHMAHLMSKTQTRKQADLIRLLTEVAAFSDSPIGLGGGH